MQQHRELISAYTEAVSRLAFVNYVFYSDSPDELDIFTVFTGDRWSLRPALYAVEAEVLQRFPQAYPNIRLMPRELADIDSLRMTTHQALPHV